MDNSEEFEVEIIDDSEQHVVGDQPAAVTDEAPSASEQEPETEGGEPQGQQGKKSRKQKAQERIAELTRKHREEERRRLELERQRENERLQFQQKETSFQQERQQYAQFLTSELESQKELLEERLHEARNRGDSKREVAIQDKLDSVRHKLGQIRQVAPQQSKQEGAQQPAQPQPEAQAQPQAQQQSAQPQAPEAARDWVEKNAFLNARTDMHQVVNGAYQQLAQTKDPSDPAFYTELNNRLKQELPQYLAEQLVDPNAADADLDDEDDEDEDDSTPAQPQSTQQPVSPSGRTTQQKPKGKQKVKLTRDEVAIARQIGITPEQYAKQKAAGATPNGYTQVGG